MALRTLEALEPHLIDAFGVRVDEILHGSIHRFHKDAAHVERVLADAANFPRDVTFAFGPVTISTQINIVSDGGGRIGYVVVFEDVTGRLALEREAQRMNLETEEMAADARAVTDVMSALARASSPAEALQVVLDTVRSAFGWATGRTGRWIRRDKCWTRGGVGRCGTGVPCGDSGREPSRRVLVCRVVRGAAVICSSRVTSVR